jgi:hypothetical protein
VPSQTPSLPATNVKAGPGRGPACASTWAVGLIGPIERDPGSRHRRYRDEDLDRLQALACLRAAAGW